MIPVQIPSFMSIGTTDVEKSLMHGSLILIPKSVHIPSFMCGGTTVIQFNDKKEEVEKEQHGQNAKIAQKVEIE